MNTAVHYQLDGELARITLNRPQRHNALVPELLDGLPPAVAANPIIISHFGLLGKHTAMNERKGRDAEFGRVSAA